MVTHNRELAEKADRVVVLKDGRINGNWAEHAES
jgi:ABC-type lipoprotein export system ATPase subunit